MFNRSRTNKKLLPNFKEKDEENKIGKVRKDSLDASKPLRLGGLMLHWNIIIVSTIVWFLTVNHYENSVVRRAMNKCSWNTWEQWPEGVKSHKVALYADPQILDEYSYPGRPQIVNYFTRVIVDHYHYRNWRYSQHYLNPDTNFFLGDLFDGGRHWDDDVWLAEYNRFNKIFPKSPMTKTVFSLPGNHDIGFGDTVIESSLDRFTTYFGDTSSSHEIGNHTFVLLDTISLSDTTNVNVSSIPKRFLEEFSLSRRQKSHPNPTILLTHVPLWRNANQQQCGKERESTKPFPIQKGYQYQTVIDQTMTQEILTQLTPKFVFSGDDHDYCHVKHTYGANDLGGNNNADHVNSNKIVDEITVKSCAMNMGIKKPAIQLVSLFNDESVTGNEPVTTIQTRICYLPDPFKPMWVYILLLIGNLGSFIIYIKRYAFVPSLKNDLPLPVSTDTTTHKKDIKVRQLVIDTSANAAITFLLILVIFSYYYNSI
ncbi:hypothetical protein KAFR_0B06120 [Kazachstania africana CBS 2517]|uniref:Calcineurin-like phosphoesterase domain-containing protein n=1 Tax=Kazachstania africana (strain ATCC 22294 / BCRC 22015 / CBS 2517 / CECT 1963 / NBRC 1671 / NRRL Y-8276) TaxID=1071382 RepID=H2ARA8_KAZAF|nr:hypothetical protein KAFR_0B06120 [Kazachstania africana CBS 2517]CCF56908.1 hypothetical protein KAFR_0B06120 [Kazachstania africana CBS 2517]